jgi:hypothetical protein
MPRRSPSGHAFSVPGCNPGDLVFLALVSLPSRLFSVPVHGCSYVSGTCEQSCTETGRQRDAEYLTWTDRDTQGEPAERRLSLRVSVSPGSKSCSFEDSCSFAFLNLLLSSKSSKSRRFCHIHSHILPPQGGQGRAGRPTYPPRPLQNIQNIQILDILWYGPGRHQNLQNMPYSGYSEG